MDLMTSPDYNFSILQHVLRITTFFFAQDEVKRLALKVAYLHSRLMKDKNKHLKSASSSLCRVRAATMDDFEDGTLKKLSSSPVSRFLSSRV